MAVVGVVIAVAAVLWPTAAGKLGKQGTCCAGAAVLFFLRPTGRRRGRQSKIRSILCSIDALFLVLCCCVAFPSIHQRRGLVCGLQPRRWWPSRRRCMIPATFSGTGTSSSATTRATGAWSPAKRDKFKSCMFSSSCAYMDVYFCSAMIFTSGSWFSAFVFVRCLQGYDEQEPLWHAVAGGQKTQDAAISVRQKI